MLHPSVAALLLSAEYETNADGTTSGSIATFPEVIVTARSYLHYRQQVCQVLKTYSADALRQGQVLPLIYGVDVSGARRQAA